jgi:hypothetical protein
MTRADAGLREQFRSDRHARAGRTRHPDLVSTAVVHEPPILELLDDPGAWADRFAGIFATYQTAGLGRRRP